MAVSEMNFRTALRQLHGWLVAGSSLLALAASPLHAQPAALDQVVAIVNEDVVLKSEFDARWVQIQQQLASAQGPLPPEAELRKQNGKAPAAKKAAAAEKAAKPATKRASKTRSVTKKK